MNYLERKELLYHLSKDNNPNYNYDKALEEASEFSEGMLKFKTKHPERKPPPQHILEEYADFSYRGLIALMTLFPDKTLEEIQKNISKHINKKLTKLQKFREEGLYKKGL